MGVIKKYYIGTIIILGTILAIIGLIVVVFTLFRNTTDQLKEEIYPMEYKAYVEKYANENNLERALVYAVIKTESNFIEDAQSGVGAVGLMQIMPSTFEWLQNLTDGEVTMDTDELLDPEVNINYGCRFLRFLLDRYTVEATAVAAYNAGFGAVDGWLADEIYSTDGETLMYIPYPETEYYVEKVQNAKAHYEANIEKG